MAQFSMCFLLFMHSLFGSIRLQLAVKICWKRVLLNHKVPRAAEEELLRVGRLIWRRHALRGYFPTKIKFIAIPGPGECQRIQALNNYVAASLWTKFGNSISYMWSARACSFEWAKGIIFLTSQNDSLRLNRAKAAANEPIDKRGKEKRLRRRRHRGSYAGA